MHILAEPGKELDTLLERAVSDANEFNSDTSHSSIGVMRAFASMDGVSKVFHIYSDDTSALEARLTPPSQPASAVG
jgi:hypothetical protein